MIPVCSAAQVRALDHRTIEEIGVPGAALMETAARGVANAIRRHHGRDTRGGIVVVCGGGNNGGDGYACARWLHGWGYDVATWSIAPASRGDAAIMRAAALRAGVPEVDGLGRCTLIVDAIFGTGLDGPVDGAGAAAIRAMREHAAKVIAVDVPSGLHADTGAVLGVAAPAVRTVTFGRLKAGLLAGHGPDLAGIVDVIDIGLDGVAGDDDAIAEIPEPADLRGLWPERGRSDHKANSGHLLLIAGSRNQAGAAVLAARGALACGVGLITLLAPEGAIARLAGLPPEVMVLVHGDGSVVPGIPSAALAGRTAVAAGPGLGGGQRVPDALAEELRALWATSTLPVVFDADAIPFAYGAGQGPRVVTPHPGEAGRVLGTDAAGVQDDRFAAATELADGRVALLKGRNTLIAAPGHRTSVNPTNSSVLATGGSGDVLLGVIGALLARGVDGRSAAILGAWVHGHAGERLEGRRSHGWTAGDIASELVASIEDLIAG